MAFEPETVVRTLRGVQHPLVGSFGNFSTTVGGVAIDNARNLAMGVDFVGTTTVPDVVNLYQIADPTAPLFINKYSFPTIPVQANANFIYSTAIGGGRGRVPPAMPR